MSSFGFYTTNHTPFQDLPSQPVLDSAHLQPHLPDRFWLQAALTMLTTSQPLLVPTLFLKHLSLNPSL